MKILPYGARASLIDYECDDAPDRADRTLAIARQLRAEHPDADIVLGAGTIAVVPREGEGTGTIVLAPSSQGVAPTPATPARTHTLAAVYDGPDLADVAARLGVSVDEIVARHAAPTYGVELLGFLPGFAYLVPRPSSSSAGVTVPRRPTPRPRVRAGSVGVAAGFTGVYPFASPGGWNLLARVVDTSPFDPARDPPVLFAPGDRVRFVPVAASDVAPAILANPPRAVERPAHGLYVVAAPACATVQDRGRLGQLACGIPPSGPLDVETHRAANLAVGNPPDAASVEVPLGALTIEARGGSAWISVDGAPPVRIASGERFRVEEASRAVRYLAVEGGVDVPLVLGARATLLAAGLGGHLGRPLRRGDVLAIGHVRARRGSGDEPSSVHETAPDAPIVVDPGPHLHRFPAGAFERLLEGRFEVSRHGDRVGVRLQGDRIPRDGPDLALPVPMIRGAVEITTDGTPIALGPDHPTTGGYPVLAVVRPASQAALARRRPGAVVRFASG